MRKCRQLQGHFVPLTSDQKLCPWTLPPKSKPPFHNLDPIPEGLDPALRVTTFKC